MVPVNISSDAAKRRSLPAWIREGLEKMEREKQRKLDKEKKEKEKEEAEAARKKAEAEAEEELEKERLAAEAEGRPMRPRKSKFVSGQTAGTNLMRNHMHVR